MPETAMKRIAVGIDFSEADQTVLDMTASLAKSNRAVLHLIHVLPPWSEWVEYAMISIQRDRAEHERQKQAAREKLSALVADLRENDVYAEEHLCEKDAHQGLLEMAAELKCDLIAVGSHSRNPIARALLGHVADRVVRKSPVPVLVVPTMT